MGYYIELPQNKNKVQQMKDLYGAAEVSEKEASELMDEGKGIVCVVENPMFDAVGFCFNRSEFDAFAGDQSGRKKTWLSMDYEHAAQLSGYRRENR